MAARREENGVPRSPDRASIARSAFRAWPNSGSISDFDFVWLVESGTSAEPTSGLVGIGA